MVTHGLIETFTRWTLVKLGWSRLIIYFNFVLCVGFVYRPILFQKQTFCQEVFAFDNKDHLLELYYQVLPSVIY